jgi:hypothetical protein
VENKNKCERCGKEIDAPFDVCTTCWETYIIGFNWGWHGAKRMLREFLEIPHPVNSNKYEKHGIGGNNGKEK